MKYIKIPVGDKMAVLKVKDFTEVDEVNVDKLLQVDYSRLRAEMITFPVILNRLGLLLADADNKLAEYNLDLEIFMAQQKEKLRAMFVGTQDDIRYKTESALKGSVEFKIKNKQVLKAQKERNYINSVYWSAKDKSDKINKLSEKIQPESFNLDELKGEINGVMIQIHEKLIK